MKYKYYGRKPRSAITRDLLLWLAVSGCVVVAATSPYFGMNVWKLFLRRRKIEKIQEENKKVFLNNFYRLRKEGYLYTERKGNQTYIWLTEEGKAKAGWMQINDLVIKKPKKWDGRWRCIIFDISQLHAKKREALRGFLKRLGFYQLQKSVWVFPYECRDEINLLKDFFGFTDKEIRYIEALSIGEDSYLRDAFGLIISSSK